MPVLAQDTNSAALLTAQSKLGYALLSGLAAEPVEGTRPPNLLVSPASLAGALTAIDLGADPVLHAAIVKSLQLTPEAGDTLLEALRFVAVELKAADSSGPLSFANALFFSPTVQLSPMASDALDTADIDAYTVDLGTDAGVAQINDWVKSRTAGLIPTLLGAPLPTARAVALNALRFKDSWVTAFDPAATQPGPFTLADGKSVVVPLMHMEGTALSRADANFAAITLPFTHEGYSLTLVTGTAGPKTIADFAVAAPWLGGEGFAETAVKLTLPKFTADSATSILPVVNTLGLADGFSGAGLEKFGIKEPIGAIVQKALFTVDETGAEAAAATAVIVDRSMKKSPEPLLISFDKPFLFALRDDKRGLVLLTGFIGDPR